MLIMVGVGLIASRLQAPVSFLELLVSWSARKQTSVALSTTEAEYIAAASCCSQILWMRHNLSDYGLTYGRVPIFIDNTSAISLAKNPVLHSRSKHIDVRFHFLRDHYEKGDVELNNQVASRTSHLCSLAGRAWHVLPIFSWVVVSVV